MKAVFLVSMENYYDLTTHILKKVNCCPRFKKSTFLSLWSRTELCVSRMARSHTTNKICLYFCYNEISLYLFYKH